MKHLNKLTYLHHNTEESGIGRITDAACIEDSRGTPGSDMRNLGSYAIVYIYAGAGGYHDRYQTHKIQPGDLILIFPDNEHAYGPKEENEKWNELYLLFEGEAFDLMRQKRLLNPEQPIMNLQPVAAWKARFKHIIEIGSTPLQQTCRLMDFLADAQQHDRYRMAEESDTLWVEQANTLILNNLIRNDCIKLAAVSMGLSYESFRKKFKQLTGTAPGKFRSSSIIEQAARLMAETDETIGCIAEKLGFCDEFHFSRRFKQITGLTPGAYRRRLP